ncbi:MAG: hypothetical protein J6V53_02050, partial [Alphaproteobacteria bacterium]|nr:hypothetical protein [Alphaproteobacteria bacterium]
MSHYSKTTLRELKKRYLNILKKCLLLNLMAFMVSIPAMSGTATDTDSLLAELEKNERTVVESGTYVLTYDETNSLYDAESNSIIFPSVDIEAKTTVSGGKLYNAGNITFNSNIKLIFKDNNVDMIGHPNRPIEGNTIHNTIAGLLTFNSKVDFLNNSSETTGGGDTRPRGIIFNKGTINFNEHVNFKDNTTIATGAGSYGTSIYNKGGIINFTSADFINNKAGSEDKRSYAGQASAILNESGGQITFTGSTHFENNEVWGNAGVGAGSLVNSNGSTIKFLNKVTFENNKVITGEKPSQQGFAAAIANTGTMMFNEADFLGNQIIAVKDAGGGAITNAGIMIFNGQTLFQGNIAEGNNGYAQGGAIYNGSNKEKNIIIFQNQAIFKDNFAKGKSLGLGGAISIDVNSSTIFEKETRFSNNKAEGVTSSGQGGALRIGWKGGSVTFKEKVVFQENLAKGITALGGAIALTDPNSILTFKKGFYFSGNKEILVTTNEEGIVTESETLNDIYMADGIINIEGTDPNAGEYIGGGINGDEGAGTINKSSVATLVFGEESDSSGYTGVFNQTAGKTVAKSETFLGGTNNILGGELETHGSEILYTAVVGQHKDETTGEVLSSGTLTHLALGSEPVEIKGLSFEEEGTNLLMTFKSGTTERGKYQINEDIMNAKGNKMAFENAEVYVDGNKTLGTVEAKNSDVNIGTKEVSVDEIALKENAVLKMVVNSLNEHAKVNGDITGTDTSKIALQLGVDLEKGIYQLFDRDNEVQTASNALFNIKDL